MVVNRVSSAPTDEDLLVDFANLGHSGPDELADLDALASWWAGRGERVDGQTPENAANLDLLRQARTALRSTALAHNGVPGDAEQTPAFQDPFGAVPLLLDLRGEPHLRAPAGSGFVLEIAAAIATALVRASARPGWTRLKGCPGPDCAWVFRDATRNGARRWCSMSECGNRAKGAAFRARVRPSPRQPSEQP